MQPDNHDTDPARTATIEAYADTIVPGEKRWPDDRAIGGAAPGGGAVAAGAVELLEQPGGGLAEALDSLVCTLNDHATGHAAKHGLVLDDGIPAFVALSFEHRTALVRELTAPGHPEKQMWVALALFSNMAFDSAAHLNTADAFAERHPGLLTIGYFPPDADGVFRFPQYSYGRPLATPHPQTTVRGDPT